LRSAVIEAVVKISSCRAVLQVRFTEILCVRVHSRFEQDVSSTYRHEPVVLLEHVEDPRWLIFVLRRILVTRIGFVTILCHISQPALCKEPFLTPSALYARDGRGRMSLR